MSERLLLLLMVHGEIDILRTQNHAILLLYHAALEHHQREKSRVNSPTDQDEEVVRLNDSDQIIEIPTKDVHEYRFPAPQGRLRSDSDTKSESSHTSADLLGETHNIIGQMIRYEATFLYRLITVTFDGKRLEQLFDWDDINDLCWYVLIMSNFNTTSGLPIFVAVF
jgi:hypothetical protein